MAQNTHINTDLSLVLQRYCDLILLESSWSWLKMSRAVIERREVSPSAKRTQSQSKHTPWLLMGWHRHIFPQFSPTAQSTITQTRWSLWHYDKRSRFDLIFTQRKKTLLFLPFTWCILNFVHVDNDRLRAVFHDRSVLPGQNDLDQLVWNCRNRSVVKQPCPR